MKFVVFSVINFLFISHALAIDIVDKAKSDPLGMVLKTACGRYDEQSGIASRISFYSEKKNLDCKTNPLISFSLYDSALWVQIFSSQGALLKAYIMMNGSNAQLFMNRITSIALKLSKLDDVILKIAIDRTSLQVIKIETNFDSLD